MKLTRSQCRQLQAEHPVGNPFGGPAYGERRDIIGDILGTNQQADAATQAANIQAGASAEGIAEQRRQFDKVVELMTPFVTAGTAVVPDLKKFADVGGLALDQQRALTGLDGPEAQQAAIASLSASPEMTALTQQGENAILQNASATGGLRGGNVQSALAKFRPQLLAQLINQQYGRLGGLTSLGQTTTQNIATMGQAAAAGQAAQGLQSASNIGNLLAQSGAAQAGGVIAAGNQQANTMGSLLKIGGTIGSLFF